MDRDPLENKYSNDPIYMEGVQQHFNPLLLNSLGVIEYNMIKKKVLTEINIGIKDMRKGNRHFMK